MARRTDKEGCGTGEVCVAACDRAISVSHSAQNVPSFLLAPNGNGVSLPVFLQ